MRLLDLRLDAFGPFRDRCLDLGEGHEGLQVIFGPNEAGKSTALRALRGLLYGIPERSADDFLHRGERELRVGARLRASDGTELNCQRRKGRKNTLLDAHNEPLPEETLQRLLGGVGRELFERRFGIDHQALVEGGRMLLEGHGEEAEALFGANLGGSNVRALLVGLKQEADALFAPRASKPELNMRIRHHAEIGKALREAMLSASQWQAAETRAQQARGALDEVVSQLAVVGRRRAVLERIRRSLPNLRRRERLLQALSEVVQVPELAPEFAELRVRTATERRDAERSIGSESERLQALRARRAELGVSEALLARAEALTELHQRLGSQRKAAVDRPRLVAEQNALLEQARRRLASVRPGLALEQAGDLPAALACRPRAQELACKWQALEQREAQSKRDLATNRHRLTETRRQLDEAASAPDPVSLERVVLAAQKAGDLDALVAAAEAALTRHGQTCSRELGALGLWPGDARSLAAAALPGSETVNGFEARQRQLEERSRALRQELTVTHERVQQAVTAIDTIQRGGTLPTEDELLCARARRDTGWQLLRRRWLGGETLERETADYAPERELPEAFETAVAIADDLADRLRREAQRVHQLAAEEAGLSAAERRAAELNESLANWQREQAELAGQWQALWTPLGITPLSPREMREWLLRARRLQERVGEGAELRDSVASLARTRRAHCEALAHALGSADTALEEPALAPLLLAAETRLRQWQDALRRRVSLAEELARLEAEHARISADAETAVAAYAKWRGDWKSLCGKLDLAAEASIADVDAFLEAAQAVSRAQEEADGIAHRLAGIDRDARQFEQDAQGLLREVANDLEPLPLAEAVAALYARLGEQRERKARLADVQEQIREAEERRRDAQVKLAAAEESLANLCRQAGIDTPEGLEQVERHFRQRQGLRRELAEVEVELLASADGLHLTALEAECAGADPDAVAAEIAELNARIEGELQPRQQALAAQQANAERDLAEMSGGSGAAELAEQAQQVLAAIRHSAEHYTRLRLARHVLQDEIERFRREHRGPILARAGEYFQRLTGNSFEAVETDYGDRDQPVLIGVRAGGQSLGVEGMSTGTRDQLYLALRLASLEHSLRRSEPLPFVVDDILIHFDDERARATLDALAEFSRQTQVILFTHHGRVAEQAAGMAETGGGVYVHQL
jgi:uncharacterized protein YhaN